RPCPSRARTPPGLRPVGPSRRSAGRPRPAKTSLALRRVRRAQVAGRPGIMPSRDASPSPGRCPRAVEPGDWGDLGSMTGHPAYRGPVLALDYRVASEFLRHHFVCAMTAHLDDVLALPAHADPDVRRRGAALRVGLVALLAEPVPVQDDDVPVLYFAL